MRYGNAGNVVEVLVDDVVVVLVLVDVDSVELVVVDVDVEVVVLVVGTHEPSPVGFATLKRATPLLVT